MRASFTVAAILAAVTFATDAEFGFGSSRRPQSRFQGPKYPARTLPRSYGGSSARPRPLTNRSPVRSSGYTSAPRLSPRQAQSIPATKSSSRSRLQDYGALSKRYGRPQQQGKRSPPKRERPTSGYAPRPRPQPKKTPNYSTKQIDLHKLAEQVEINTLLNQSLQMKVNELSSMVIELQDENDMQTMTIGEQAGLISNLQDENSQQMTTIEMQAGLIDTQGEQIMTLENTVNQVQQPKLNSLMMSV